MKILRAETLYAKMGISIAFKPSVATSPCVYLVVRQSDQKTFYVGEGGNLSQRLQTPSSGGFLQSAFQSSTSSPACTNASFSPISHLAASRKPSCSMNVDELIELISDVTTLLGNALAQHIELNESVHPQQGAGVEAQKLKLDALKLKLAGEKLKLAKFKDAAKRKKELAQERLRE
jgi:hypothetical protein